MVAFSKLLQDHGNKKFPTFFTAKDNSWILFFVIVDLGYEQARTIESHIRK